MTQTGASKFFHKVCDMAENFMGCISNIGPSKMGLEMDLGIMAKSLEPSHVELPFGLNNTHGNKTKLKPLVHGPLFNFIIKLKKIIKIHIFGNLRLFFRLARINKIKSDFT